MLSLFLFRPSLFPTLLSSSLISGRRRDLGTKHNSLTEIYHQMGGEEGSSNPLSSSSLPPDHQEPIKSKPFGGATQGEAQEPQGFHQRRGQEKDGSRALLFFTSTLLSPSSFPASRPCTARVNHRGYTFQTPSTESPIIGKIPETPTWFFLNLTWDH